jgi:hypothetical protein
VDHVVQVRETFLEVELPEELSEIGMPELGDIIDEDVEFSLLAPDFLNEVFHLNRVGVIDGDGDALAAAHYDHSGGFIDRFGAVRVIERRDFFAGRAGNAIRLGAAAGAINGGAGFAQGEGDAAADAAGGAGDEGDAIL